MPTPAQRRRFTDISVRLGPVIAALAILIIVGAPTWAYGILAIFAILAVAAIIVTWQQPPPSS